jgi:hypothetical protein
VSTRTIASVNDIRTYVCNSNPGGVYGYEGGRLVEPLVEAIRAADHPAFGRDWSEWLDENVETLVRELP